MNARALGLCIAALLVAFGATSRAANVLPIYIEDNHAGTFYWLTQTIDLEQPCTLILFDAHSDASGIFDSDKIRNAIRNVASVETRRKLLDRWRNEGAVQCSNWIEPLMPAPIPKVIWVPARNLLRPKSASTPKRQRRCSKAISKQPRENRDHYVESYYDHGFGNPRESY